MIWVVLASSITIIILLMFKKNEYPLNYWLLFAFTVVESYMIGIVCVAYASVGLVDVLIEAFVLTAGASPEGLAPTTLGGAHTTCCARSAPHAPLTRSSCPSVHATGLFLGLTLFAMQTRIRFSFLGAAMYGCLCLMLAALAMCIFFDYRLAISLYALGGACLFCLYILYGDEQQSAGGAPRRSSPAHPTRGTRAL